jgi:hypothetical protein
LLKESFLFLINMLSYIVSFFKPTSVSSLPLSLPSATIHPLPLTNQYEANGIPKKYSPVFTKGLPIKDEHKPGIVKRYKMF